MKTKDAISYFKNDAIWSIILGIACFVVGAYLYGRLQAYPQLKDIPFWVFIIGFITGIFKLVEGIMTWFAVKTIEKSIKKE